jgi:hypothetical protein
LSPLAAENLDHVDVIVIPADGLHGETPAVWGPGRPPVGGRARRESTKSAAIGVHEVNVPLAAPSGGEREELAVGRPGGVVIRGG